MPVNKKVGIKGNDYKSYRIRHYITIALHCKKFGDYIIGAGMVDTNAGKLIAGSVLALEMGTDVEDIALTVDPHPTLSETSIFAAEVAEDACRDIYIPER